MTKATLPLSEAARLRALNEFHILDSAPEKAYDDIVLISSEICGTPIALSTFIDEHRQWFKARVGLDATETSRDLAFCAHAINDPEPLVVADATLDSRFADNPFVTGDTGIRFYAGAPLITSDGHALGTLCVIDRQTRVLSAGQMAGLQALARQVVRNLELGRTGDQLADALKRVQLLSGLLPICAHCKRVRDQDNRWHEVEDYVHAHADVDFTHGMCQPCFATHFPGA